MSKKWLAAGGGLLAVLGLCFFMVSSYLKSDAFAERAAAFVSEKAAETLDVQVALGQVRLSDGKDVLIEDIKVSDKDGKTIVEAENAEVHFDATAALRGATSGAVKQVIVRRPQVTLTQREDGTWNVQDFVQEEGGKSEFAGKIIVEDGTVIGMMGGKSLTLEEVAATIDMKDAENPAIEASCVNQGTAIEVSGHASGTSQDLNVSVKNADLLNYLSFVPEGTLPEEVSIGGGIIDEAEAVIHHRDSALTVAGKAKFHGGAVTVQETEVTEIEGQAQFTQDDVFLFTHAEAAGQPLSVHGRVRFDAGSPYLMLVAESEGLDPSAILTNVPVHANVSFRANIHGTVDAPAASGTFHAVNGDAYGVSFQDAVADVSYAGGTVQVKSFDAHVMGGKATGEGELRTSDMSYDAHIKADDIDLAALPKEILSGATGRASADVGLHGVGDDLAKLKAYGSVSAENATYRGAVITRASASILRQGNDTVIDAAHILFGGGGEFGAKGTVVGDERLDISFYASHVNMANVAAAFPQLDMAGRMDAEGSVQGPVSNPNVRIMLGAVDGHLYKQPFDTLDLAASGSLDGVGIDAFALRRNGRKTWMAQGTIGFAGEKRVNLQIDTVGARMEDIAALVAPDQPITGNVDNILTITGTLDNPEAVGYVHFYRGSYGGLLLSGMDGDYRIHNRVVTVQDFHIFSPLVDMDLNGTADQALNLDMKVAAHDVQLKRIGGKLPYPVDGHAKFDGQITGSVNSPKFDGHLTADSLMLNGQEIQSVEGLVTYAGQMVRIDELDFTQNGGTYHADILANLENRGLSGTVDVKGGDVQAIAAIANQANNIFTGRMDGTIQIGGTVDNPSADIVAKLVDAKLKGYDVEDVHFDARLADRVFTVDQFAGRQGSGTFSLTGSAGLPGAIEGHFEAQDVSVGMLANCAGIEMPVSGVGSLTAEFGGTTDDPAVDAVLEVRDGGTGTATFDSLAGKLHLKHGQIHLDNLVMAKAGKEEGKVYRLRADGMMPIRALQANREESVSPHEQFNLDVSMEDADLGLLPILSPEVDWAMGAMAGNLKVTGTLAQPLIDGAISLPEGAMKLKALENPITDMKVLLSFVGNEVMLEQCDAKMGDGKFRLLGGVKFSGSGLYGYDFDMLADKLDVACDFFHGPVSGNFHFGEGEIWHRKLPKISGTLVLDNALVSIPTIPDSEGELPDMILDVGIQVGDGMHFYSPSLYNVWLKGNAHFGGTTRHPQPSGTIEVRKGTVTYNDTEFRIREGEAYFNQVDSFLPSIHFAADARMASAKIFLAIDGPLSQMKFSLTSSPEMSQEEILKLLTFRTTGSLGDDPASELAALMHFGLQLSFLGDLETKMRNMLSLDEFKISGEAVTDSRKAKDSDRPEQVYTVEFGKYINDKVMIRGKKFIGTDDYSYGVRYDFDDRMSMYTGHDTEHGNMIGFEARIKF